MIFLDNASTTKPDDNILTSFLEYSKEYFNPSANYTPSINLSKRIDETREEIVKLLNGTNLGTFLFTSSSSEANNIIINSVVTNNKNEEYIFSSLEHPSVYNIAINLLNLGRKVHFVNTLNNGEIDEEHLYSLINNNTKLVSLIHVSNETGAINNVNKISEKVKELNSKTLVHVDGVQALGKINVDCSNLDFYTISSHKVYGIKGIAGFYVKNLNTLKPFILGGGQEFNIRSGTTNAPMIFAFYNTIKNAIKDRETHFNHVKNINNYLTEKLKTLNNVVINSNNNASPYILSVSILGLNAETVLNALNLKEIYVGLGSACSSKKKGNRVLESMGKSNDEILGNIRLSFSKNTTKEEIDLFFNEFSEIISNLREKLK